MEGKADREPAPFADATRHPDLAAVGVHDLSDQGQPQPAAAHFARQSVAAAVELLEDAVLLLLWNADASIFDRQVHPAVLLIQNDAGPWDVFPAVLYGVVQEVEQSLLDRRRVRLDDERAGAQTLQVEAVRHQGCRERDKHRSTEIALKSRLHSSRHSASVPHRLSDVTQGSWP